MFCKYSIFLIKYFNMVLLFNNCFSLFIYHAKGFSRYRGFFANCFQKMVVVQQLPLLVFRPSFLSCCYLSILVCFVALAFYLFFISTRLLIVSVKIEYNCGRISILNSYDFNISSSKAILSFCLYSFS